MSTSEQLSYGGPGSRDVRAVRGGRGAVRVASFDRVDGWDLDLASAESSAGSGCDAHCVCLEHARRALVPRGWQIDAVAEVYGRA